MLPSFRFAALVLLAIFSSFTSNSQSSQSSDAAEIRLALKKLNVLGSVLYVAAHPDDENTRLITWLANEKLVRTGYFSFTRGDGGQNLIGPEIGTHLGVIRTQELLQARRTDGGEQFFSTAIDFGFSKNPDETFTIWDEDKVLGDLVWVIRKFKPDVIITRFSSEPSGTHGHHTASAILAEKAFKAAADERKFPEQLAFADVWQPKKLYWNTSWWFFGNESNFDKTGLVTIDVGGYNPLLGKSYTEIAALSRTMHKSQGFGATLTRGSSNEYLKPIFVEGTSNSLFDNINLTWSKIEGGTVVEGLVQEIIGRFNPEVPSEIIPDLIKLQKAIENLPENPWKKLKIDEIKSIIRSCAGLYMEAIAGERDSSPGSEVAVKFEVINRSAIPITLERVENKTLGLSHTVDQNLEANVSVILEDSVKLPEDMSYTQPYWLKVPGTKGMFAVDDQKEVGMAEDSAAVYFSVKVKILDTEYSFPIPLVYKSTDPVKGEVYQPFEVTPPVFLNFEESVLVFANTSPKKINVLLTSAVAAVEGDLSLTVPEDWKVSPKSVPVNIVEKGEERRITFTLTPPESPSEDTIKAQFSMNGRQYSNSRITIDYEHIPTQTLFPEAEAKIVKLNIQKKGELIGYVMGAGDNIPSSLMQIGYKVDILDNGMITKANLKKYDAIIIGIRAYNTNERLKYYQPVLMDYVENGGTMIVQYNTNSRLVTDDIGPYPFSISRDRVTVEDAPVKLLAPNHTALNFPNKITSQDFENWVQERGLYFPDSWSKEYTPLLSSNDPGETPKNGGLLVARHGKGYYIYTGYSWFRELPAGVPGAYRLFTNLISLGKNNL